MRLVACVIILLAVVAVASWADEAAPRPRLEVYASGTTARPWRVRLVDASGGVLFTHSSTFASETAAVARAEEIRAAMGSDVALRYPSWVAPPPPPSPDPLDVRSLHEATVEGTLVADLIAKWGPPRSVARWNGAGWERIEAGTPWPEGVAEERITTWGTMETVLWCVQMDRDGRVLTRSVAWDALPAGPMPWTR